MTLVVTHSARGIGQKLNVMLVVAHYVNLLMCSYFTSFA